MSDAVLAVRHKATWALANICSSFDCVVRDADGGVDDVDAPATAGDGTVASTPTVAARSLGATISLALLHRVTRSLLAGLQDNEKVAVAAVRALGRCAFSLFESCGGALPRVVGAAGASTVATVAAAATVAAEQSRAVDADLHFAADVVAAIAASVYSGPVKVCCVASCGA
jgi:hypothetical protein